jgi:hypothetical protein
MTRTRISLSWRTIRGMRVRIAHRRRVAVKPSLKAIPVQIAVFSK